MTIRKTLLRAFLLIGLAPAILLAVLAFVKARAAMQDEIERGLAAQAGALAADVNKILFERLQNGATWSTLEVMQDLQVQDVDKRLSNFLDQLNSGYGGVYRELYALDRGGAVVASSAPGALGRRPAPHRVWRRATLAGAALTLERPRPAAAGAGATLAIHAPIRLQFRPGMPAESNQPNTPGQLGELVLEFDWGQIDALLDSAASGGRMVALLDADGAVLAGSRGLRESNLLSGAALAGWNLARRPDGAFEHAGAPLTGAGVLAALGRAGGFAGFEGLGLSVLVAQTRDTALAPLRRMAEISLAILAALVLLTLAAASKVSDAIARPVVALTDFTRRYQLGRQPLAAPAAGGEVGQLGLAFTQMMAEVERSQRDLVRASKLALLGEMSSVIMHEVRTPLGILRSSAQMLRRESGISAEGRELMGFIESETERLNRLISSMLDSARPRALDKTRTDLHALIRQTRALLGVQIEKAGVVVRERLAAADPALDCDGEQITQVLLNLILNAVQMLEAGGQIVLATRDDGDWLVIEVADDGPGIAPAERQRIFEAFFCRREGGVGLGLAIVQQIMLAHGGDIAAGESELGGACFTLRLPRAGAPSDACDGDGGGGAPGQPSQPFQPPAAADLKRSEST